VLDSSCRDGVMSRGDSRAGLGRARRPIQQCRLGRDQPAPPKAGDLGPIETVPGFGYRFRETSWADSDASRRFPRTFESAWRSFLPAFLASGLASWRHGPAPRAQPSRRIDVNADAPRTTKLTPRVVWPSKGSFGFEAAAGGRSAAQRPPINDWSLRRIGRCCADAAAARQRDRALHELPCLPSGSR